MNVSMLILLLVSHYIFDYTHCSTQGMLAAKRFGTPLGPIFQHAVFHMMGVSLVLAWYHLQAPVVLVCLLTELLTHFLIDTGKGRLNKLYPVLQENTRYPHWYIFGLDQLLHQLVMVGIWYMATHN